MARVVAAGFGVGGREPVRHNDIADLPHLIRFGRAARLWLQVDDFSDAVFGEDVMPATDSLGEAQRQERAPQFIEPERRIAATDRIRRMSFSSDDTGSYAPTSIRVPCTGRSSTAMGLVGAVSTRVPGTGAKRLPYIGTLRLAVLLGSRVWPR